MRDEIVVKFEVILNLTLFLSCENESAMLAIKIAKAATSMSCVFVLLHLIARYEAMIVWNRRNFEILELIKPVIGDFQRKPPRSKRFRFGTVSALISFQF